MPRKPKFAAHQVDHRFDRWRNRVGRLFRGGDEVGLVLVTVQAYAIADSGHLWWTRWSPSYDILWPYMEVDGQESDSPLTSGGAEDELTDYEAGVFRYYGEPLQVRWATQEESVALRQQHFPGVGSENGR